MKKINTDRSQEISFERVSFWEVEKLFKLGNAAFDKQKAHKTQANIERAGLLTYEQYLSLFWNKPYLTDDLTYFKISHSPLLEGKIIILPKKWKLHVFKILHTYINNQNIIHLNSEVKWSVIFDQNISFTIENAFEKKYLKPDGIILKDEKIIFVETDRGKEWNAILKKKSEYYRDFIIQEQEKWNLDFNNVQLYFYTISENRIASIKENKVFHALDMLNLVEYSVNR
jgi:hypothetical protein